MTRKEGVKSSKRARGQGSDVTSAEALLQVKTCKVLRPRMSASRSPRIALLNLSI